MKSKICKYCRFYKGDYGIWCVNGWSRDGSTGHCMQYPVEVRKNATDTCSFWEQG